ESLTWMTPHHDEERADERIVEIWNAEGTSALLRRPERKDSSRWLPRISVSSPDDRTYRFETLTLADGTRVRVLTGRFESERVPLVMRMARSEEPMRRGLWQLAAILTLAFPVAIGLAGFGGYLLARRALAKLDDAFDRLKRFTADASHELRTPLTALRSV